MKRFIALAIVAPTIFFAVPCRADNIGSGATASTMSEYPTNQSIDSALSNAFSAFVALQAQVAAVKAATTVQTIVFSNGIAVATNSVTAPLNAKSIQTYTDIAIHLIEAFGSLAGAIFVLARILRKAIPDSMQTGALGKALAHSALEVNPQLTPTPPNVPNPAVVLTDQSTGAKVEPETVNPQPKV